MVNLSYIDRSKKARQLTLDVQNKTLVSIDTPTTKQLMYISGANGKFIAVGYDGTILYYDSSLDVFKAHSQSGVITTNNLYYLDTSLGDGVAVGEAFTILDYDESADTFSAKAISGYDTDVSLLYTLFPYTAWGILYDLYAGYDTVTGHGKIYSWNGGATPTEVLDTSKGRVFSFITFDWVNYVAVGWGGGIYKSSDNGRTWTTVDVGVTDDFVDIGGVSTSELWIISNSGKIYKFNSDTNELTLIKDTNTNLTRVWMLDVNDGYIVGAYGTLIHYDGDEWTVLPSGTNYAFNCIYGLEHNKFYLACSGGAIFRFYNMAYPSVNIDAEGNVLDYRRLSKETIINSLEIRDTNTHNIFTDSEITVSDMSLYSFASIKVINNLDQDISVQVMGDFSSDGSTADTIGSPFTVSAGDSETRILSVDTSGWQPYIYLQVTASVAPLFGEVIAYIEKKPME